jgi:hypothetical protein
MTNSYPHLNVDGLVDIAADANKSGKEFGEMMHMYLNNLELELSDLNRRMDDAMEEDNTGHARFLKGKAAATKQAIRMMQTLAQHHTIMPNPKEY